LTTSSVFWPDPGFETTLTNTPASLKRPRRARATRPFCFGRFRRASMNTGSRSHSLFRTVPALAYPLKQRVGSSTRRGMLEIADCIANDGPYNGNRETGAVKTYRMGLNRSLSEEIT